MGSLEVMVKSMLDLRQLETMDQKKTLNSSPRDIERQSTSSLQEAVLEVRAKKHPPWQRADWLSSQPSKGIRGTNGVEDETSLQRSSDYTVEEPRSRRPRRGIRSESQESRSPDSACSLGYHSRGASPEHILSASADAESLDKDSSDEENAKEGKGKQKAEMTSIDEALRTVTGAGDTSQEDFLVQNFKTLSESCRMAEQSRVPRLTMSSRFLARGHNNRGVSLFTKMEKQQSLYSSKPPVSKVRPLMEDCREDKTLASPGRTEGPNRVDAPERECASILKPVKKKGTSGSHLWRFSNPPTKAPPLLDRTSCIQKSHSAQNLASSSPHSPVPSSDRKETCKRPQQLCQDHATPSFHISSPSTGSPQSPQSPQPWESPKLKSQHSYMNPTASSMAKSSRSSSLGDGMQVVSPPCSPTSAKSRRSSLELGADPLLLASSPSSASSNSSCSLSNIASPTSIHPPAAVTPNRFSQNIPPSRIPLPRQPLSPRRSLCLEVMPSSTRAGCDITPKTGSQAVRHLSLSLEPSSPHAPVKQMRDSVSASAKEPEPAAEARERPLVHQQAHTGGTDPQPDHSITLDVCRQTVTELHSSLRKTVTLYTTVLQHASDNHQEMRSILSETLLTVKAELDSLPPPTSLCDGAREEQQVKGEGEKTMALLEQYAELLLKSVERRLETKS